MSVGFHELLHVSDGLSYVSGYKLRLASVPHTRFDFLLAWFDQSWPFRYIVEVSEIELPSP